MNQAEVVHAGWGHRDKPNLSLLEVCQADVRDSVILDTELRAYASGTATGADGPSYFQTKRRQYVREVNMAMQMGNELLHSDCDGRAIDPEASFRLPEIQKRAQKGDRKDRASNRKQNVPTATSGVTDQQDFTTLAPLSTSHVFPTYNPGRPTVEITASQPLPLFPLPNANFSVAAPPQQSSFGMSFTTSQTQQEQWHSGWSPHHYEICLLPSKVKKCYGCGNEFVEKYRKPPFNIIVKHMDRRVVRRNEVSGHFVRGGHVKKLAN